MDKRRYFLKIFKAAEKKYGTVEKRLAAENWPQAWQTLVATIMSAQSRDETTLPIAEKLFAFVVRVEFSSIVSDIGRAVWKEAI